MLLALDVPTTLPTHRINSNQNHQTKHINSNQINSLLYINKKLSSKTTQDLKYFFLFLDKLNKSA